MTGPTYERTRRELEREFGELLERHHEGDDLDSWRPYEGEPVAFVTEVLGEDPWSAQRRVLRLLEAGDRVAWRSAQAIGKSRTIAYASLWWVFAVGGQVLISAPTARTAREVLMRKEVARLFHQTPELPGELYTTSLRVRGDEPAILAYTSTSASGATGHHDSEGGVLAILDEAQGVLPEGWEAMDANTTGRGDKQFVCGNPLRPTGPFFEVSREDSGWRTVQTSATDHPNIQGGRHIPGGPSQPWLERMRDRWGEGSPMWTARVDGEFPLDSVEGLYRHADVEAALQRASDADWTAVQGREPPVVAVDVARHGRDESVACVRRGGHVEALHAWSGAGTEETARRVARIAREAGVTPSREVGWSERQDGKTGRSYGRIVVDAVGVGAGAHDALEADNWPVEEFKASQRAADPDRYANRKASCYWRLRELLEGGEVGLPEDRKLREELLAVKWSPDHKGRVQVEGKGDLESHIGRSPDRLDSVVMSFADRADKSVFFVGRA